MAQQLLGKTYKDMGDTHLSREEFRARKANQKEAKSRVEKHGAKVAQQKMQEKAYGVKNLEDFDLAATGVGSALSRIGQGDGGYEKGENGAPDTYGRGREKLGLKDVRNLWQNGVDKGGEGQEGRFTLGELQEYGESLGGQKFGKNAQKFLAAKMAEYGADAKFQSGMKRGRGDLSGVKLPDNGGGTTPPDVPDESDTTIPVDASTNIDNSDNLHQEQKVDQKIDNTKTMTGSTVNIGDIDGNVGMIDASVNDLSISFNHQGNSQTQSNGGGGGGLDLDNPWTYGSSQADRDASLVRSLGVNENLLARSDLRMKPYTARDSLAEAKTDGIVSGFDQRVVNTTDHFGNLSGVTSGGLLGIWNEIAKVKPVPAPKVEPEYDDD